MPGEVPRASRTGSADDDALGDLAAAGDAVLPAELELGAACRAVLHREVVATVGAEDDVSPIGKSAATVTASVLIDRAR